MDTFTTVLSVFSTVCAIVFGYIAFVRNRDKDKESNVKHDATVLTEIGYIKANTDEIKAEQKEQRKTNTEFVTRLTDVEASAKQAHKRLDHIEKRMGSSRVTPAAGASPPLLYCKGGIKWHLKGATTKREYGIIVSRGD